MCSLGIHGIVNWCHWLNSLLRLDLCDRESVNLRLLSIKVNVDVELFQFGSLTGVSAKSDSAISCCPRPIACLDNDIIVFIFTIDCSFQGRHRSLIQTIFFIFPAL